MTEIPPEPAKIKVEDNNVDKKVCAVEIYNKIKIAFYICVASIVLMFISNAIMMFSSTAAYITIFGYSIITGWFGMNFKRDMNYYEQKYNLAPPKPAAMNKAF